MKIKYAAISRIMSRKYIGYAGQIAMVLTMQGGLCQKRDGTEKTLLDFSGGDSICLSQALICSFTSSD